MTAPDDLREQLAALAHEQWCGRMRYMHTVRIPAEVFADPLVVAPGSLVIPPALAERWQRQMRTPYAELPEEEKASDRVEADRVLALLRPLRATLARADWALRLCDQLPDESIAAVREEIAAFFSPLPAPPPAPAAPE